LQIDFLESSGHHEHEEINSKTDCDHKQCPGPHGTETQQQNPHFFGERASVATNVHVTFKVTTYTHSLFHIKKFIYHKFTPHNDHALYLIVRIVYDCRAIKDNLTFH
jgi:hypothetical protein